jgi:hypothetical protein
MPQCDIFMLQDKSTGDWYVRGGGWSTSIKGAAVWTTIGGPISAKGAINSSDKRKRSLGISINIVRDLKVVIITTVIERNADA